MSIKPNRKTRNSRLSKIQQTWIKPPKDRPWAKIPIDIMDGERWRGMSVNERRVIDVLICQHFRSYQKDNGDLQISYKGFKLAGVTHGKYAAAAIKNLIATGMIEAKQGMRVNHNLLYPSMLYGIAFYRPVDGYIKEANRNFIFVPVDVMESPDWCGLSINARRILDRLMIENRRHDYEKNGSLRVSYEQFEGHGAGHRYVASSLRELESSGLLAIKRGKCRGERDPNLYRLTYHGTTDGPATWKAPNVVHLPKRPKRKGWKESLLTETTERRMKSCL
jgi:hypothetical protein